MNVLHLTWVATLSNENGDGLRQPTLVLQIESLVGRCRGISGVHGGNRDTRIACPLPDWNARNEGISRPFPIYGWLKGVWNEKIYLKETLIF